MPAAEKTKTSTIIQCSQKDLKKYLGIVSRAVPQRPTHPLLGHIKWEADKEAQAITLTAFDLNLGIQVAFSANVNEDRDFNLPAKLISDIVNRLPEGDLTLTLPEDDKTLTLTSKSGKFRLQTQDNTEFPDLPSLYPEQERQLEISVGAFFSGIGATITAASTEEHKQILRGVCITQKDETLAFAATDGHRLSLIELDGGTEDFEIVIPARSLKELQKSLEEAKEEEMVHLACDGTQAVFSFNNLLLTTRSLGGAYPAYRQLLPASFARSVTMNRKDILSAMNVLGVLAEQENRVVNCVITQGEVTLSVDAKEIGTGEQRINADVVGEDIAIAFNHKYLVEGLKAMAATEIELKFNDGSSPLIFTPLGEQITYLIMPVQLRD